MNKEDSDIPLITKEGSCSPHAREKANGELPYMQYGKSVNESSDMFLFGQKQ